MNAELTQPTEATNPAAWVFYDGECRLCVGWARRVEPLLKWHHLALAPLQDEWVRTRLGLEAGAPLREMRMLTAGGEDFGGAEALAEIARRIWWAWPVYALTRLPGVRRPMRALYDGLAARRHGCNSSCGASRRTKAFDWLPLALLPVLGLMLRPTQESWAFMWTMAFALFFGCKWLTWRRAKSSGGPVSAWRSLGYLLAWPGMDAAAFLRERDGTSHEGSRSDWLSALAKTALGMVLTWGVVRLVPETAPLLAGWVGLVGLVFVLHFGLFHLLALMWQRVGVNAPPIMRAPLLATSLAEFCGRRWNIAFHQLVHELAFRPLRRLGGTAVAMLAVFLLSGLVHELVISVPARGGYGLPTAYFSLQSVALWVERSALGRAAGLGRGLMGRLFTFLCAAGPLFWLFHPPFVGNVILPFLKVIHAR